MRAGVGCLELDALVNSRAVEAAVHKVINRPAGPPAAGPSIQRSPIVQRSAAVCLQQQPATRVSSPSDPAEKEAESTAARILRMPAPAAMHFTSPQVARFAQAISLARQHSARSLIARKAEGEGTVSPRVASDIANSRGSGHPLPAPVRSFMEPRFGANFGGVRIHTGESAATLNRQVQARAFTVGNQIFFGRDQFQPESSEGRHLIAHELTHTIQQGAVQQGAPQQSTVQRSADFAISHTASEHVQRLGVRDVLGFFATAANAIPGYRMFTILLGVNPIDMSRVDRSAANILRAIVEFLPGGALITQALDAYGIFERVGGWIEQQLRALGLSGATIREALNRFLDSLSFTDIFSPGAVWERARRIFSEPIDRIISFARGLFSTILRFVKDAVLMPIARLASQTRGWDLLCAVLGQNPITGEAVPRTAETLIGGFMKLIGQEEIWENIKRGNAVARAWAWFQGALGGLLGFVRQIPQLFIQALTSLEIADLVILPRAFARVAGAFANFVGNFLSWAGNTVWNLLEIIFSVVAPEVMVYLRRAAGAFRTILQNPMRFVGLLVRAAMTGFQQFATNFLTHLRASLIGWLTGALGSANVYIPQSFTLREIIKFVLSVLGLTWQNIRGKLVRVIGETAVGALETGFDIVATLVTQGPAAAWEKIQESLSNLREMVIEQVMTFVKDRIVTAAITRLLSMLSPAGAFIQAIIATYNTVMFFVERLRQIAQVAAAFIDSIATIAAGNITAAANRVEQTLAGLLTLVISFLARLAGLGNVSDAVINVINRVRQPIDRALDRVVEWIVATARRLGRLVAGAAGRVVSWWQTRGEFRAGTETHSLYFVGDEANAELTVASTPRQLEAFLAGLPATANQTIIASIRVQIGVIRTARRERSDPTARNVRIADAFRQILGVLLPELLTGATYGTRENPLEIDYPKPAVSQYRAVYIGPRTTLEIAQTDLERAESDDTRKAAIAARISTREATDWGPSRPIMKCLPLGRSRLPTGVTIGVAEAYQTAPGLKFLLVPGHSPGGGRINAVLRPFGFRAPQEDRDGDHVVETQIGGPDSIENLWPLKTSTNRSAGGTIASMAFDPPQVPHRKTMAELKNEVRAGKRIWLRIRSNSGSDNG